MSSESFGVGSIGSNPLLLTINQVADLLNLGRTKTYELVMSNRIKSVKLGRRRLVPRCNLDKYVAEPSLAFRCDASARIADANPAESGRTLSWLSHLDARLVRNSVMNHQVTEVQ